MSINHKLFRHLLYTLIFSLGLISLSSLTSTIEAQAQPKTSETSDTPATDFLKSQVVKVLTLTAIPIPDAQTKSKVDAKLFAVIKPMMDFPAMSKASLGKYWEKQSIADQNKFMQLFEELVFHSYMKKIRKAKQDASIEYEDESARPKGGAEVEAITSSKNMGEVELRFILRAGQKSKKEASYVAEDVIIDEVSLVNNYKEEFIKIINKSGFAGLLKKMEEQIKKVK